MFWRLLPKRMWGWGLLLIAGLAVAFYLVLAQGAKSTLTQQLLHRRQTLARAQASNLASFFQVFGKSIAVFSQLSSMQRRDSTTLQDMTVFVDQWRDSNLIGGVVLTDAQGVVQLNANVSGTSDVGASLADRDYFAWAKNHPQPGEYLVGQPVVSRLGASKGQLIVPVAAAVYRKDNVFVGVLAASVKLQPLTERYLALMKADSTNVYLIDHDGKLLYSGPAPNAVGSSILELLPELEPALNTTEEGNLQATGRLIAYAPVLFDSQNWSVIMASPIEDVMDLTVPIYIRQIAVLLLVACSMLLFGVVAARDNQIKRE